MHAQRNPPETLAMRCILLAGVVLAFQLASMCHVSAFVSTRPPHVSGHVSAFLTPRPLPLVRKAASARARRSSFACRMSLPPADVSPHMLFLKKAAGDRAHPRKEQVELLARILLLRGHTLSAPEDRGHLHPYLVPLTKDPLSGQVTGLLYDASMDVSSQPPVVRTVGNGLELLSPSLDFAVKRLAVEEDFKGHDSVAAAAVAAEVVARATANGLERYLLVNTGPAPDLYRWLVNDWLSKSKPEEALITCARASRQGVLQDWGSMHYLHSETLSKVGEMLKDDRELEARDCARAALQLPLWSSGRDVEKVVCAADSSMPLMLESYRKWCGTGGPEEDFVNSGDTAAYRSLGRARYLLDSVSLDGELTYSSIRQTLAEHLDGANRRDLATLVRCI